MKQTRWVLCGTAIISGILKTGVKRFGNMHGLSYLDVYKQGFVIPVVNVQCDFKLSLRYGDRVIVETKYIPTEAAKMKFTYRLYNAVKQAYWLQPVHLYRFF
jgi:acyl-CoA thioesterase FadM